MRLAKLVTIMAALSLPLAACGKDDKKDGKGGDKSGDKGGDKGGDKAKKGDGMPDPPKCDEKNEIAVTWGEDSDPKPPAFEHKFTTGYLSGMRYNGKSDAKIAYVVASNVETKFTMYGLDMPKEPNEVHVILAFKTESHEHELAGQKEWYTNAEVGAGEYPPGSMDPKQSVQVSYFVGGANGGPIISGGDSTGSATITKATGGGVCGTIDFTSAKGTTVKGTFNAPLQKDLWAKTLR